MAKDLRRPFAFGPYTISCRCVGIEGRVVHLNRRVEAVEDSTGVGCLIGSLGGDDSFSICLP